MSQTAAPGTPTVSTDAPVASLPTTLSVLIVHTPATERFARWAGDELTRRGHTVGPAARVDTPQDAAPTSARLAGELASSEAGPAPLLLAAGWEAGVTAHLAAQSTHTPLVVRPQRSGRTERDAVRMLRALSREAALLLVPSAGELERLAAAGFPRSVLRVLPEAVDTTLFTDEGREPATRERDRAHRVGVAPHPQGRPALVSGLASMPSCEPVVVPAAAEWDAGTPDLLRSLDLLVVPDDTDDEIVAALAAMACGVPVVASDHGVLADVVADDVTGLLVGPGQTAPAIRSLLPDVMRRESLGLAAVDRVRARFSTEVVGRTLEHLLADAVDVVEVA